MSLPADPEVYGNLIGASARVGSIELELQPLGMAFPRSGGKQQQQQRPVFHLPLTHSLTHSLTSTHAHGQLDSPRSLEAGTSPFVPVCPCAHLRAHALPCSHAPMLPMLPLLPYCQ
jgi:hypothetical protein